MSRIDNIPLDVSLQVNSRLTVPSGMESRGMQERQPRQQTRKIFGVQFVPAGPNDYDYLGATTMRLGPTSVLHSNRFYGNIGYLMPGSKVFQWRYRYKLNPLDAANAIALQLMNDVASVVDTVIPANSAVFVTGSKLLAAPYVVKADDAFLVFANLTVGATSANTAVEIAWLAVDFLPPVIGG